MNNSFDWSLIRSFLAALDHGSLLGAARALGSSQPTVGRHITELERQLGVILFERTGRGLAPTQAATQMQESARAMEAASLQMTRGLAGSDKDLAGAVRLTASVPMACYILPQVLARMRLVLPQVQIELVSSNQVSNLLRREADIAVRMVQPDQGSLIAKRIGKISIGAYAHRDYLARRGTPRQTQDWLNHDIVANDKDDAIQRGFRAHGLELPVHNLVLRTDDLIAYWQAVRAGLGLGFVADYIARTDPLVSAVPPPARIAPLPVWLAVHREIRSNRRIRAVYDFLAEALPPLL